jgi:prepilin-type N-terminal cleavage/methylation domain-containing protein
VSGRARIGFTLVELLIVIAIIALLVSILLPSLARAKAMARLLTCQTNMSAQVKGHAMYAAQWNDLKPPILPGQDRISPNLRTWTMPSGQGVLVDEQYVELDAMYCTSTAMEDDAANDQAKWENDAPTAGSSYVYFYRREGSSPSGGVTYDYSLRMGRPVLAIDVNCRQGHRYLGEYSDRAWPSHPSLGRVNVAGVDGSVKTFDAPDLRLGPPGRLAEELNWWDRVNEEW